MQTSTEKPRAIDAWFSACNLDEEVLDGSYYVIGYRRSDYERVTVFSQTLNALLRDLPKMRETMMVLNVGQVGSDLTPEEQRLVDRALHRVSMTGRLPNAAGDRPNLQNIPFRDEEVL